MAAAAAVLLACLVVVAVLASSVSAVDGVSCRRKATVESAWNTASEEILVRLNIQQALGGNKYKGVLTYTGTSITGLGVYLLSGSLSADKKSLSSNGCSSYAARFPSVDSEAQHFLATRDSKCPSSRPQCVNDGVTLLDAPLPDAIDCAPNPCSPAVTGTCAAKGYRKCSLQRCNKCTPEFFDAQGFVIVDCIQTKPFGCGIFENYDNLARPGASCNLDEDCRPGTSCLLSSAPPLVNTKICGGCLHNGVVYQQGQAFADGCKGCVCHNNKAKCFYSDSCTMANLCLTDADCPVNTFCSLYHVTTNQFSQCVPFSKAGEACFADPCCAPPQLCGAMLDCIRTDPADKYSGICRVSSNVAYYPPT
eukprot:jgi/Chlat1/8470/Chrsp80S07879